MKDINYRNNAKSQYHHKKKNKNYSDKITQLSKRRPPDRKIMKSNEKMLHQASIQNPPNFGIRLTSTDYENIIEMGSFDPKFSALRFAILLHIIGIFNNIYKEDIIKSLDEDSYLTDDQKTSIDCLFGCLILLRNVGRGFIRLALPLLNDITGGDFIIENSISKFGEALSQVENKYDYHWVRPVPENLFLGSHYGG